MTSFLTAISCGFYFLLRPLLQYLVVCNTLTILPSYWYILLNHLRHVLCLFLVPYSDSLFSIFPVPIMSFQIFLCFMETHVFYNCVIYSFHYEYFQFPARNRTLYFYCYMLQIFPLFPFLCPHTIYLPVSAIILMSISFNPSLRSSWKQYLIRCFILRTVLSRVMLLFQQVITLPQKAQYTSIQK